MVFEFKLPDVGEGIHEGEIVNWLVDEGDQVEADEDIVEVMTDKATVQISSPVAGTIQALAFDEGDVVEVGQVFVLIEEEGAAPTESEAAGSDEPAGQPQTGDVDAGESEAVAAGGEPEAATASPRGGTNGGGAGEALRTRTPEGVLAPPSVRIEARKRGIDIAEVEGSGPAGRVSMEDLDAHASREPAQAAPSGPSAADGLAERFDFDLPSVSRDDAREVVPIRAPAGSTRAVAHRATTLQPHFTHALSVSADDLFEAIEDVQAGADEAGVEIDHVAPIVKALAQALGEHPRLNALVDEGDDELVLREAINVAVAVPTEDGHELRVVAEADRKGLVDIARTLAGGGDDAEATVTVAVLDDEGGFVSMPILMHPQVAGMVVGSPRDVGVLDGDEVRAGREINLSFSFDHRWIDGYDGALMAEDVRELLEQPGSMLLG